MSMLVKKYCRLALLPLLMLALFSCSKQTAVQESELSLQLSCEQSFLSSKAGEGSIAVDCLHYFVFADGESTPLSGQTIFDPTGTNNLKLRLFKDKAYVLAFWAQNNASGYDISASGKVSFPETPASNDSKLDAFYATVPITGGQGSLSVTLKRAVAKINVNLSTALSEAATSSLSFDSAYKTFSLISGDVSDAGALSFSSADCRGAQNVAFAYLFAPQDQSYRCTMSLKVYDSTPAELLGTTLANIPVQRNIQTNITYNN